MSVNKLWVLLLEHLNKTYSFSHIFKGQLASRPALSQAEQISLIKDVLIALLVDQGHDKQNIPSNQQKHPHLLSSFKKQHHKILEQNTSPKTLSRPLFPEQTPDRQYSQMNNFSPVSDFGQVYHPSRNPDVIEQKLTKMKQKMELEFEMTRQFIKNFVHYDRNIKQQTLSNATLAASISLYKKQHKNLAILSSASEFSELKRHQESSPVPEPAKKKFTLNLKKVPSEITPEPENDEEQQRILTVGALTDRCYIGNSALTSPKEDPTQTRALLKLNKLEKFIYIRQPQTRAISNHHSKFQSSRPVSRHPRNQNENQATSQETQQWHFSPPKSYYKQQNESLKILQDNLRTQLEAVEKYTNLNVNDSMARREEQLRKKQNKLKELEEELFKKQMQLNKRHIEIIRKEKALVSAN